MRGVKASRVVPVPSEPVVGSGAGTPQKQPKQYRWGAPYKLQLRVLFTRTLKTRRFEALSTRDFCQFLVVGVLAGELHSPLCPYNVPIPLPINLLINLPIVLPITLPTFCPLPCPLLGPFIWSLLCPLRRPLWEIIPVSYMCGRLPVQCLRQKLQTGWLFSSP